MTDSKGKRSLEDADWLPESDKDEVAKVMRLDGKTTTCRRSSRRLTKGKHCRTINNDGVMQEDAASGSASATPSCDASSPSCTSKPETEEGTGELVKEDVLPYAADEEMEAAYSYFLSDEILLKIFSYLPGVMILTKIKSVCRRWRTLSVDPYLWTIADFSFTCLKPVQVKSIVKNYCHKTTKSIALKGPAKRPRRSFKSCKHGIRVVNKCVTVSILKDIKKSCPTLQSFSLSHEQIAKLSLFTHLPTTITHLSLPFCNLTKENFQDLILHCPFTQLTHLDLSGSSLVGDSLYFILSDEDDVALPSTLRSLVLDDIGRIPIFALIEKQPKLTHLSLSYNQLDPDFLLRYSSSEAAKDITSLHLRGCLLCPESYEMRDGDFEDWSDLWSKGFPSLKRLDIRAVTFNSGEPADNLHNLELYAHLVDVDGTVTGDWTEEYLNLDYREDKYNADERRREENRLRWASYGGCRFRRWRPWFDDSDEYYSDEDDIDPLGGEADCSLM